MLRYLEFSHSPMDYKVFSKYVARGVPTFQFEKLATLIVTCTYFCTNVTFPDDVFTQAVS